MDDKASILPNGERVVCGDLGPIIVPGEGGPWVSCDHVQEEALVRGGEKEGDKEGGEGMD